MSFVGSYIWKLRQIVGNRRLIVAGVGVLVMNSEGKIWMGKRAAGGEWAFFGGAVELGDSIAKTACKELQEETGLKVQPEDLEFVGVHSNPAEMDYTYPNGDEVQIVNNLFLLRNYDGKLPLVEDDEHTEFQLVSFDTLPSPVKGDTFHSLRLYKSYLQTGKVQVN